MIKTETAIKQIKAMGFHPFKSDSGIVFVSGDYGDNAMDYYGEYRGGYPWINPNLLAFAEANKCYFEWDNPGGITMYEQ